MSSTLTDSSVSAFVSGAKSGLKVFTNSKESTCADASNDKRVYAFARIVKAPSVLLSLRMGARHATRP